MRVNLINDIQQIKIGVMVLVPFHNQSISNLLIRLLKQVMSPPVNLRRLVGSINS